MIFTLLCLEFMIFKTKETKSQTALNKSQAKTHLKPQHCMLLYLNDHSVYAISQITMVIVRHFNWSKFDKDVIHIRGKDSA